MKKSLFSFLSLLAFALVIHAEKKPNIIFVMVDDLGYGDLSCYGQEKFETPNLDQMANEGMRFTDFYSGNAVCAPARCSLITGKHPGNATVRGNYEIGAWNSYLGQLPIRESEVTIFDVVKKAGYVTAAYGKWGLGHADSSGAPHHNGVDDFFGFNCQRHAHTYYPRYLEGNRGEKIWLEGNDRSDGGKVYAHDLFTEKALEFIAVNKENPFFLYLPYTLPHGPFMVPESETFQDKDWSESSKKQAAMIELIDRDMGLIFKQLKELGIDKDTIVFFTSDNGPHGIDETNEFFNASGSFRGKKTDLYEGGIRTPMIVRWPGRIAPGGVSDLVGAFWDVMPTFADLIHQDIPSDQSDGISFLNELLGKSQEKHEFLYWEYFYTDYSWKPGMETLQNPLKSQAIRMGKWKAIRHNLVKGFRNEPVRFSPVELYNLELDPSESQNVADSHPELVAKSKELMNASHTPNEYFNFSVRN
ncbi:MAG: arylsulfatase [Opitutales bacterium]|nr:arylsulfatase [Opitutales bacterium]